MGPSFKNLGSQHGNYLQRDSSMEVGIETYSILYHKTQLAKVHGNCSWT
jgi:hypothetical protein